MSLALDVWNADTLFLCQVPSVPVGGGRSSMVNSTQRHAGSKVTDAS